MYIQGLCLAYEVIFKLKYSTQVIAQYLIVLHAPSLEVCDQQQSVF